MRRLKVTDLPLGGLKCIERNRVGDRRGFLSRLFCSEELAACWHKPIAQVNHAYTARRGAVRGMHYQVPPQAEVKLVSCIRGEAWDVAVDLRAGSPTFLEWYAMRLSRDNGCALLIPEGFAHGFQALTDDVELLYCHSAVYSAEDEAALSPKDPRLAITWPLDISELSACDAGHPMLHDEFAGVVL